MTRIDSQKLLNQRNALHYTRKEVADLAFISERYLSDLEHGVKSHPSAVVMHDIAHALHTPLEEFFTQEESIDDDQRTDR